MSHGQRELEPINTLVVVTETAFAPPYQGDSARIAAIIHFFVARGWRVHVIHFHDAAQTDADYQEMELSCTSLRVYRPTAHDLSGRESGELDDWCPDAFVDLVATTVKGVQASVVLVQFVFFSRCLEAVGPGVLRVLDADNIFAGRKALYTGKGLPYTWFTTDAAQESRAIQRADIVLAIQEKEHRQLVEMAPNADVLLIPHVHTAAPTKMPAAQNLLFVGNDNEENKVGLTEFLFRAWPNIHREHPDARLRIAGRLAARFHASGGIEPLGVQPTLARLYADTRIVLNLAPVGTGLKIKTVEALCHGRCLVSTRAGIQGLEAYDDYYLIAEHPEDFSTILIRLLSDPASAARIGQRAADFATRYFSAERVLGGLERLLRRRSSEQCPTCS